MQKKPTKPDEIPAPERNPEIHPIPEPEPYYPKEKPEIIPEREPLAPNPPKEIPERPDEL